MATISERILEALQRGPMDDDALAAHLGVSPRQSVNQAARRLEEVGRIRRVDGTEGKIVNALLDRPVAEPSADPEAPIRLQTLLFPEDDVKRAVKAHLED